MVGRAHTQLYLSKTKELSPKVAGENWVMIRYDMCWQAMKSEDVIHEGLSNFLN
jgi:hypothetical protein